MDLNAFEIIGGLVLLTVAFYYYLISNYDYWSSRGVPGPEPKLVFGNLKDVLLKKVSFSSYLTEQYRHFKDDPWFGIYSMRRPILVVRDPEYIKEILIKNFTTFADRGIKIDEKIEPLFQHLFSLEPARWRPLRMKLSPTFTSGKLKDMFYLLTECADHFEKFLDSYTKKNQVIECRDLTAKFTTDVIGVCAFGLNMNAIGEEDSDFRKFGRKFFEPSRMRMLRMRLRDIFPWLFKLLGSFMYDHEINDFFIGSVKDTMEYRTKNNIKRNDFIDLLMDIKNNPSKVGDFEMTDILITAQAFIFFIAGFETSSTTMSHALYELALNQPVQDKLREEISEELRRNNDGELKYETVKNMKYMHKVFCETLRKYPPLSVLMRSTTQPHTFSGSKLTIPKGMRVFISAYAIQHDPQIYPDPEAFDPERFSEESIKQRHPSYYLPFGDGPRNCIGARFANYQTKVGLIKVLKNYRVDVCDETCIPYVINPMSFLLAPMEGIKLKFNKIQ